MEASTLLRSSLTSFTYELIARLPTHCPPEEQQGCVCACQEGLVGEWWWF